MIPRASRPRAAADVLAAALLLALPWLLYGAALGLWWTGDDLFQLRYTLEHAPREYALDPATWQRLPNRVLSPLLFVSYELDLALFGLDPEAFYGHQLLSLGLAAAALYGVLRLWLGPGASLAGGVVFLSGPPVAALPAQLMVRHYPEAILLGLAATGAFVLALRRRNGLAAGGLAALSALLYLAASAAKEIAVPLPGALALLPAGPGRRRLLLLVPHAAVLALYAVYRTWMLGTPLGGYGWAILPGDWPGLVAALPGKVARELAGPSAWGWVALGVLLAAALGHALRSRPTALLLPAGAALALLPVLPASVEMAPRLAAAAWLVVAVAAAAALHRFAGGGRSARRRIAAGTVAVGALVLAFAGNRAAWSVHHARAERMSTENRGFLELGRGELLRHPASPPAAMSELPRFAREVLGRPAPGGWFYDDLFLCGRPAGARPIRALWEYDAAAGRLVEVPDSLPELRRAYCSRIRRRAPLAAVFRRRAGGVLAWTLGPHREGRYAFVLDEGRLRYDVPRRGAFGIGALAPLTLRVRYESPGGWITYSPPLTLDLPPGETREWRRTDAPSR